MKYETNRRGSSEPDHGRLAWVWVVVAAAALLAVTDLASAPLPATADWQRYDVPAAAPAAFESDTSVPDASMALKDRQPPSEEWVATF